MIFVTVGTHEQPFDRLIQEVDKLKQQGIIEEDVVIQTGYCNYEPHNCTGIKLLTYEEMKRNVEQARIVITHGGPSSFIMPLQIGKVPIVVPRQKKYNEHVNDHQVEFVKEVCIRHKNILPVYDIKHLAKNITEYSVKIRSLQRTLKNNQNNKDFNLKFSEIVSELLE